MTEATIFAAAWTGYARGTGGLSGGSLRRRRQVPPPGGSLAPAHAEPDELLDPPEPQRGGTIDYAPIAERPGTVIGPYKLLEQIGEGGMGVVFVAEQQQPVRRKVALKIIKPGMDTRRSSPASRPSGRRWP